MKQIKEFVVISILTVFVLLSCKKEEQDTPITPSADILKEKIVKAKVIEYGSDLPIEGATLSICTTAVSRYVFECAGDYINFYSNTNGECFFKTDSVYLFRSVAKDWYDGTFYPNCLLDEWIHTNSDGTLYVPDSFTVRLVPYRYVTVHVKDTGTAVDTDKALLLHVRGLVYPRSGGDPGACSSPLLNQVTLRPQIDTTLYDYFIYGNADNEFIISEGVHSWENLPIGVIHREIKYIPKEDSLTVEIIY